MATVLVPLGLGAAFIGKRTAKKNLAAVVPMVVAILATVVFFIASYYDWVPLWHRRYFVAVLPMLAWTTGVWSMMGLSSATSWAPRVVAFVLVIVVTSLLMWQQGTSQRLTAGRNQLVTRGEDWRGAIQWVKDHRAGGLVFLDSGLIELNRMNKRSFNEPGPTRIQQRYFTFPVRGPYAVSASIASAKMHPEWGTDGALLYSGNSDHRNSVWIISRSQRTTLERWCNSFKLAKFHHPEYRRFGRIWVARIQAPTVSEWNSRMPASSGGAIRQ
jgi:hypothetical protein